MNSASEQSAMTHDTLESTEISSESVSRQSQDSRALLTFAGVAASVFALFFLMGFVNAWLKGEGTLIAMALRGLKFGTSGSIGVTCIGIAAKSWQQLQVPEWVPPIASMAVGFFVMNGLGEFLDGNRETILPKAGSGLLTGAIAGAGLHWAQTKGWIRQSGFGSRTRRRTAENPGKES
ncbi:MAG: hypothetical protein JNL58_17590 [Planctomyces sp.]|nr:hypothetical protein [Planctomyces sp.]